MKYALIVSLTILGLVTSGGLLFSAPQQAAPKAVEVKVTEQGFQPATVTLVANVPAKISFVRQTDKTCATAIVIPDYNITRELPLNQPVVVELTPKKTGDVAFLCGMNMLRGKIVVQEK